MGIFYRIRAAIGLFGRDRSGNFAMLAALAAIPMMGAAGLAVDYSTMSRMRVELQQALDAAVLAVAQRGDDIPDAEAYRIAGSFMTGNLAQAYRDLVITREGTSVTLAATTPARLAFGGLFGYGDVPINAASTADIAVSTYEVALVLDTTGSMRGGKLTAMKEAVIGLIDDLSSRITDKERLKFALVPFASFVNVGPQFGPEFDDKGKIVEGTGADWLDLKGVSPIAQLELKPGISRFELFRHLKQDWTGCVETRMASKDGEHDVDDTQADEHDLASYFVPAFSIDEPNGDWWNSYEDNDYIRNYYVEPWDRSNLAEAKKLLKYGLLKEAQALHDIKNLPGGNAEPGANGWAFPRDTNFRDGKGPNKACVTQPITPLSNDYVDLKRKVQSFQANGNTNIMEGTAWGMRVLSPEAPFTEGKEAGPGIEKVMIVLTDGSNVFGNKSNRLGSSYSSFGYLIDGRLGISSGGSSATTAKMNEKTLQACRNAKDRGAIVYTIRLEEPDVRTGTMLEDCATGPGHYFDTPSRSQLDEVFKRIRDGITRLRLSS